MQSFVQKQKSLNLAPKMPYLGVLLLKLKKNYRILEMSNLEFAKMQKFVHEKKIANLGLKMSYLCNFVQ